MVWQKCSGIRRSYLVPAIIGTVGAFTTTLEGGLGLLQKNSGVDNATTDYNKFITSDKAKLYSLYSAINSWIVYAEYTIDSFNRSETAFNDFSKAFTSNLDKLKTSFETVTCIVQPRGDSMVLKGSDIIALKSAISEIQKMVNFDQIVKAYHRVDQSLSCVAYTLPKRYDTPAPQSFTLK